MRPRHLEEKLFWASARFSVGEDPSASTSKIMLHCGCTEPRKTKAQNIAISCGSDLETRRKHLLFSSRFPVSI
jgi:hypothetical protein